MLNSSRFDHIIVLSVIDKTFVTFVFRPKAVFEVRKLRHQLTNVVKCVLDDTDLFLDPKMNPPTDKQVCVLPSHFLLLIIVLNAICSSWCENPTFLTREKYFLESFSKSIDVLLKSRIKLAKFWVLWGFVRIRFQDWRILLPV